MGKGQEQSSRHLAQIVEPTDGEKAAAKAARTFGRSFAHDSTALGVVAFALVFLIVLVVVVVTVLAVVSVLVARHHYLHPGKSDVFAAGGCLFHASFMRDKEEHEDGRGIVRVNVVGIAECAGFHNRKDRTVWILPSPDAHIYDVWRRGRRWEDERELCLALLEKGVSSGADTDPFFGVDEKYRGFLERIGVRIEETTKPVDFLAGTWS